MPFTLQLPRGLCGYKLNHEGHLVTTGSLAPYWCHADQTKRLPYAAERARQKTLESK